MSYFGISEKSKKLKLFTSWLSDTDAPSVGVSRRGYYLVPNLSKRWWIGETFQLLAQGWKSQKWQGREAQMQ